MANLFWVGGTAAWDATPLLKWSATSGGVGGLAVPMASDNVFFDAASGAVTVTAATGAVCLGLSFAGFTGTFAGVNAIGVSAGLTLSAAMTLTYSGVMTFNATATGNVITSAGIAFPGSIAFDGGGGGWSLADALTITNTGTTALSLSNGALDLNSKNLSCAGRFTMSTATTRSIAFGTGEIRLTGNNQTNLLIATSTGFSFTGGGVINFTYAGATGTRTIFPQATGSTEANTLNYKFSAGSDIIAQGGSGNFGTLDFTGFAGTFGNANRTIYGELTGSSGMTWTPGTGTTTLGATSGPHIITSNGKTLDFPITVNGIGGSWALADDFAIGATRAFTLTNGTFASGARAVSIGSFALGSGTKTLSMGSGAWTCALGWDASTNVAGLTVSGTTGTISMTSASAKTFAGGGKTWPKLNQSGAGTLTITGANTFSDIGNTVNGTTVTLPASATTTVLAFTLHGASGSLTTLNSSSSGTPATLSKASGTVSTSYLSIKDITVTGGATWAAPTSAGNVNAGGNSGWNFAAVSVGGNGLSLGLGLRL